MKFIDRNNFNLADYKLSPQEYQLKIKERPRPIVLDIRPVNESESGTVEHAYRMPSSEFADCLIQLPPFGAIILYSDIKDTNIAQNMELLWKNGFTDLFYVVGGFEAIMESIFELSDQDALLIKDYLAKNNKTAIQLDIDAYSIKHQLIAEKLDSAKYKLVKINGITIYFLHRKLRIIDGTKIFWHKDQIKFDHARWHQAKDSRTLMEKVQVILDRDINPMVASHGGYVKLIEIKDDAAYVEMTGGCQGCGMSAVTLKQGVEAAIFQNIPEIQAVYDSTDHEQGENPYYAKQE